VAAVTLTLLAGTLVGLLLHRLGRLMAGFNWTTSGRLPAQRLEEAQRSASIRRVPATLAVSETAAVINAALAQAAGRPLIIVVRDAHRHPAARAVVTGLLAARPDTVVVDMGLPLWRPPARPARAPPGWLHNAGHEAVCPC